MNTSYYQNLDVWKKSIDFVEDIYRITHTFPKSEYYGPIDQMRRASISIPSNIAEGSGRNTDTDYLRFLHIAKGSALEIETQIIIAKRLGYIDDTIFGELTAKIAEIIKMIGGFIEYKKKNL